jgi:hypothetical protein
MDCSEIRDRVIEIVSAPDAAPASLQEVADRDPAIQSHLGECRSCQNELTGLVETWALVGLSSAADCPEGLADRIASKVLKVERSSVSEAKRSAKMSWQGTFLSYAVAASILAALIGGQAFYLQRLAAISRASRDPSESERVQALEQAVAELERLQAESRDAKIRFVSFRPERSPAGNDTTLSGHAVWDRDQGELHFFGFGSVPLEGQDRYAIWFVRGNEFRLAKTLPSQPGGGTVACRVLAPRGFIPDSLLITVDRAGATVPSAKRLASVDL